MPKAAWTARAGPSSRLARQGVPAAAYNLGVMRIERQLPGGQPARGAALVRTRGRRRLRHRHAGAGAAARKRPPGQGPTWWQVAALEPAGGRSRQRGRRSWPPARRTTWAAAPTSRPAEAARWFREAAKGGDVGAQYLLASMYEQGDGVDAATCAWRVTGTTSAAKNGDVAAPGKVRELDARVTP
jgi:TPR repeat protein